MSEALTLTGDTYLVEHNSQAGRDLQWSDNFDGTGTNWLGLQLMLIRDKLSGNSKWTNWLRSLIDFETGAPLGEDAKAKWQDTVMKARDAIVQVCVPNLCTSGCGKPSWNGMPGQLCGKFCKPKGELCSAPACSKFTWDGKPGFCSLDCKEDYDIFIENQAGSCGGSLCARAGCGKPSWSGTPGDYCGMECKEDDEAEQHPLNNDVPIAEIAPDNTGCAADD